MRENVLFQRGVNKSYLLLVSGEAEEEDEDEYEAESSDEEGEEDISLTEEPGNDSGCTAVVALLRGIL